MKIQGQSLPQKHAYHTEHQKPENEETNTSIKREMPHLFLEENDNPEPVCKRIRSHEPLAYLFDRLRITEEHGNKVKAHSSHATHSLDEENAEENAEEASTQTSLDIEIDYVLGLFITSQLSDEEPDWEKQANNIVTTFKSLLEESDDEEISAINAQFKPMQHCNSAAEESSRELTELVSQLTIK